MTIYLSGPMTGYPKYNVQLFGAVAYILMERGYDVVNPHTLPEPPGLVHDPDSDWWLYIRSCLNYLHDNEVDMVLLLPGYECSFGSDMEVAFAAKHGIPVKHFNNFMLDEFLKGAPKEAGHD